MPKVLLLRRYYLIFKSRQRFKCEEVQSVHPVFSESLSFQFLSIYRLFSFLKSFLAILSNFIHFIKMFVDPIDFLTTPTACLRYSFNASLKKKSNPVWMLNNVWICCSSKSTSFRMRCQLKHFQKQHSLWSNKWSDRASWTVSSLYFYNLYRSPSKKSVNILKNPFFSDIQVTYWWITSMRRCSIQILMLKPSRLFTIHPIMQMPVPYWRRFSTDSMPFVFTTRWVAFFDQMKLKISISQRN